MVVVNHDMSLCSQCYECIHSCPGHALSIVEGVMTYSQNNCTLCETCTDLCDSGAIIVKVIV